MSNSTSRITEEGTLRDKLALARLSRWRQLEPETLVAIREELAITLGLAQPLINAGSRDICQAAIGNPEVHSNFEDPLQTKLTTKTRQLISAGASWYVISEYLWTEFTQAPSPHRAARFLETAFVHASPGETLELFGTIMSSGHKDFYWLLHPKLRDFLIEHSPEERLAQLYWVIAKERDDFKLTGIECAYLFLRAAMTSDKTAAWMYFRRHQTRIFDAFGSVKHFGMTKNQLIVRAGELALGIGYTEDARDLFETLPKGSPERETALQLILRFESSTVDRDRNSYFIRVEKSTSWQERLILISSFCDTCRASGGVKDPNRSALDLLLKNLLQWVPQNPEAWRAVGDLIIRHRDLRGVLPSLFKPLIEKAVTFHGPDFDGALWGAALNLDPESPMERFLLGSALLHHYVTNPRIGEKILWQSNQIFHDLGSSSGDVPWAWRDLLKMAKQWISQSTMLADRDRRRVVATLRLAMEGSMATPDAVDQYMSQSEYVPRGLLQAIAGNAIAGGNIRFATDLLIRAGSYQAFTNKDLLQLWTLASKNANPDLSWRLASVLAARDVLPATIKHAWEISGERRSAYTPVNLTIQDIDRALSDLPLATRRLTQALCTLGTKINELSHLNAAANLMAPALSGTSTVEQSIVAALKNTSSVPKPTKMVAEPSGLHLTPPAAVVLAQAIINGPWLFSVRLLAERLSMSSWAWNVITLQNHVKSILPLVGKDPSAKTSVKMAGWITSLTSGERSAWNLIVSGVSTESSDILSNDLVKVVCRLATILYPSHFNALKTLQQLRAPLDVIRDLEWFIVSEALSEIRSRHSICARVSVPDSLKKDFI